MTVDWNAKSTAHLKLILDSLLRYQSNAKTFREKRNVKKNIAVISDILKERTNGKQSI